MRQIDHMYGTKAWIMSFCNLVNFEFLIAFTCLLIFSINNFITSCIMHRTCLQWFDIWTILLSMWDNCTVIFLPTCWFFCPQAYFDWLKGWTCSAHGQNTERPCSAHGHSMFGPWASQKRPVGRIIGPWAEKSARGQIDRPAGRAGSVRGKSMFGSRAEHVWPEGRTCSVHVLPVGRIISSHKPNSA